MINNILLYNSGGGIGDAIQILPLIDTLKRELRNINIPDTESKHICEIKNSELPDNIPSPYIGTKI